MLDRTADLSMTGQRCSGLRVVPYRPGAIISLRGSRELGALASHVRVTFDCELPPPLGVVSNGAARVCWLRPTECWVLHEMRPASLDQDLAWSSAGAIATALNLTDAMAGFRIEGSQAETLIASGCALDLTSGALRPGRCARTRLADVPVLLLGTAHGFELYVARSYRNHFEAWVDAVTAKW